MVYKVLRLLEYTYATVEDADGDMRHWQLPQTGIESIGTKLTIRSAIIQYPKEDDSSE